MCLIKASKFSNFSLHTVVDATVVNGQRQGSRCVKTMYLSRYLSWCDRLERVAESANFGAAALDGPAADETVLQLDGLADAAGEVFLRIFLAVFAGDEISGNSDLIVRIPNGWYSNGASSISIAVSNKGFAAEVTATVYELAFSASSQ